MWEILFYLFVAPFFTLLVTLVSALKFNNYILGPIAIFVTLNIPTILLPMIYNIGWEAPLGWASLFTGISAILSLFIWLSKRKSARTHIA